MTGRIFNLVRNTGYVELTVDPRVREAGRHLKGVLLNQLDSKRPLLHSIMMDRTEAEILIASAPVT